MNVFLKITYNSYRIYLYIEAKPRNDGIIMPIGAAEFWRQMNHR